MRTLLPALVALSLAVPAAPAAAGSLSGVTLPDTIQAGGQDLVLNGMGLRKRFVIKVYVGGLYLPQKERSAQQVLAGDKPYRMVMHFLYGVGKDQMCDAWNEGLAANTPNASAEVKKAFTALCGMMGPIEDGEQLVLTYLPGKGIEVEIAGQSKGTLPGGPAVADALLATWIGPKPGPGEDFKKGVLGG